MCPSKYVVFSGSYSPAFGLNTQRYFVSLRIQFECGKMRTRKNSVFGHISHSDLISNRSKQFDVFRDELPTPKRVKIANLQMLIETDKGEIKSAKESGEKFQNEEKKSSDMKTKAISMEKNQQTSIDYFLSKDPNEIDKKSFDYLANIIAEKLNISNRFTTNVITHTDARNITELLKEIPDIEILGENDSWILLCKSCFFYLSSPVASLDCTHKPTGNSIATSLKIQLKES